MDEEVALEDKIGVCPERQKFIDLAPEAAGQGGMYFGEEAVESGGVGPGAEGAGGEGEMFVDAGDRDGSEDLIEEVDEALADEVVADVVVDGGDEADLGLARGVVDGGNGRALGSGGGGPRGEMAEDFDEEIL